MNVTDKIRAALRTPDRTNIGAVLHALPSAFTSGISFRAALEHNGSMVPLLFCMKIQDWTAGAAEVYELSGNRAGIFMAGVEANRCLEVEARGDIISIEVVRRRDDADAPGEVLGVSVSRSFSDRSPKAMTDVLAVVMDAALQAKACRQMISSSLLPTKIFDTDKEALEAWGCVFGEPDAADSIFAPVTLPDGWSVAATDHPMWFELLDAVGRARASIFYKSSVHEEAAHMYVKGRYCLLFGEGEGVIFTVTEGANELHRVETHWPRANVVRHECEQWCDENLGEHWDHNVKSWEGNDGH